MECWRYHSHHTPGPLLYVGRYLCKRNHRKDWSYSAILKGLFLWVMFEPRLAMETELCQALHSEELHRNAGVARSFSINQIFWAGKSELCCNLTSRLVRSNIINSLRQYAALSTHLHLDAGDIISRFNESDEEETPSGVESSAAVRVTRPHSVVGVTSTEDAPGCSCTHRHNINHIQTVHAC